MLKSISIAIIILCLGIIGCAGTNEPSFNSNSTYNVVSVSKKSIDYWLQIVTHKKQDYGFCNLNQNHHSNYNSVSIRCNILGDTLTGVCMFGGQYSSGGPG